MKLVNAKLIVLLLLTTVVSYKAQTLAPMFPVGLSVPIAPAAFQSGGKTHLVYELHVDNFRAGDVSLSKVEIFNEGKTLATYQDTSLDDVLSRPGTNQQLKD